MCQFLSGMLRQPVKSDPLFGPVERDMQFNFGVFWEQRRGNHAAGSFKLTGQSVCAR
jgi:hypothetical protein